MRRRINNVYMEGFSKSLRTTILTMANESNNGVRVVCVTGAGGYIASWLVKNLLQSGYTVHATLRDPGDERKCKPLLDLAGAQQRLKFFEADLLEEGSFDSAVDGCEGVFHLASPIAGDKENSSDDYIVAAVNGVQNVMRACTKAKSVRRVVFTSSLSAACPLNDKGELASSSLDESCWSPIDFLKSQTNKLAWYMAAKALAEHEALKYGAHSEFEVVTILPPIVLGPWFTETPGFSSSQTVLSLIKGNEWYDEALRFIQFTMGSIAVAHIDDVCNAHIFLMEHPNVQGRHVCSVDSRRIKSLKEFIAKEFNISLKLEDEDLHISYLPISSKKLLAMGFSYKYSLEQAFKESIDYSIKKGILML